MNDIVTETVVDVPTSGGDLKFLDDMTVTMTDAPMATETEAAPPAPAAKTEPKTDAKADDKGGKEDWEKPAWVRWTDEGGMRIEPGKGATLDANGNIVLDPEVAQRMATKRVMRVRDEERARADRMVRQEKDRAERLERELIEARQSKPTQAPADKPWAAQGATKPKLEDFDDVEQFMDARDEWRDAQTGKSSAPEPKPTQQAEQPTGEIKRSDFDSDDAYQDAIEEERFSATHGRTIAAAIDEGRTLYPDFDTVAGPLVIKREAMAAVIESDNASEVLYYLGSHPDEVEKLQGLEGTRLQRAIWKIETTLASTEAAQDAGNGIVNRDVSTATPKGPVHQPAPVITPVRGGAAPRTSPQDLASLDDCDPFFSDLKARGL